jgi:hypothetical protein
MFPITVLVPASTLILLFISFFKDPIEEKKKRLQSNILTSEEKEKELQLNSPITAEERKELDLNILKTKEDKKELLKAEKGVSGLKRLTIAVALMSFCISAWSEADRVKKETDKAEKEKKLPLTCTNLQTDRPQIKSACGILTKIYDKPKIRDENTKVQYYPKNSGNGRTDTDIEFLGFKMIPPIGQDDDLADKPINAIWYGSEVKLDDVKDVAYSLIATGVKLKLILKWGERKENENPKRKKLIQIGADTDSNCNEKDFLKVKEIEEADEKTFPVKRILEEGGNCPSNKGKPSRSEIKKDRNRNRINRATRTKKGINRAIHAKK